MAPKSLQSSINEFLIRSNSRSVSAVVRMNVGLVSCSLRRVMLAQLLHWYCACIICVKFFVFVASVCVEECCFMK